MEVVIRIAQLLLSLSILVIIHELGHFAFAKLFKTRVEKFYLFFDPWFSLFKIRKGETEYGIGWLPLGGYVKIAGMIDESMDKEQMKQPAKPDEFRSKTTGQRLLIMVGGVLFNLILAVLIYAGVLMTWGEQYLPTKNMKYGVYCDSLALEMGMQHGDKILSVDGKEIEKSNGVVPYILLNEAKTIEIERDGQKLSIDIPQYAIPRMIKGETLVSPRVPFIIGKFVKDAAGEKAGLQIGDRIVGIDTIETPFFDQFAELVTNYKNQTVPVSIVRNGMNQLINVQFNETGKIGAYPSVDNVFELSTTTFGFFEAFPAGVKKSIEVGHNYLKQFKLLFNPETKAYESVGGFIAIGKIFPGSWDWESFWSLTGFLSIMLGILNILPIPALDGGHVMFLLYEVVTRRKPSDKFMEYAQMAGLIILLALLLFANGNDVLKFFK